MPEMEQNNSKKFLVLKIIAFELGTTNSHNPEQDTCHWRSIWYETPLPFTISLKEIFCESGSLSVMKIREESALMHILQGFWTLYMLNVKGCSEMLFFRERSNLDFDSL